MSSPARRDRDPPYYQGLRRAVFGRSLRWTLGRVALLSISAYVIFGMLLTPVRGEGVSMQPTLANHQLAFVNRVAYWRTDPSRGDIVALRLAGPSVVYIKRIVGLPGERIAIVAGLVHVNGRPLDEPYVVLRRPWEVNEMVLSDHEYLVIGDNRSMSVRQQDFGKAQRDRIIGRVVIW